MIENIYDELYEEDIPDYLYETADIFRGLDENHIIDKVNDFKSRALYYRIYTPDRIHNLEIPPAKFLCGGYDCDDVDLIIDYAETTILGYYTNTIRSISNPIFSFQVNEAQFPEKRKLFGFKYYYDANETDIILDDIAYTLQYYETLSIAQRFLNNTLKVKVKENEYNV